MNVFILCTGRSGSTTFTRACNHITNFSSAHESRCKRIGEERVNYPYNHIEIDHYLSWFLGRLGEVYGEDAYYVHLKRNHDDVAESFSRRKDWIGSLSIAYHNGILKMSPVTFDEACSDLVDTVNINIRYFLKDKPHFMEFRLENAKQDWETFWQWIGAEGDFERSMAEWEVKYNSTIAWWRRPFQAVMQRSYAAYRALFPR